MLDLARRSIEHGLKSGRVMPVNPADYPPALREPGACFVTLRREGRLRGCIGAISAYQSLAEDIADKAFSAAFRDPRFAPLLSAELGGLELHISVLSPLEELVFESEDDLIRQIAPGRDGLVLEDGGRKGTFIPAMWEQLPGREEFWSHLKLKAGLPADHWSGRIRVWRFSADTVDQNGR